MLLRTPFYRQNNDTREAEKRIVYVNLGLKRGAVAFIHWPRQKKLHRTNDRNWRFTLAGKKSTTTTTTIASRHNYSLTICCSGPLFPSKTKQTKAPSCFRLTRAFQKTPRRRKHLSRSQRIPKSLGGGQINASTRPPRVSFSC